MNSSSYKRGQRIAGCRGGLRVCRESMGKVGRSCGRSTIQIAVVTLQVTVFALQAAVATLEFLVLLPQVPTFLLNVNEELLHYVEPDHKVR
jgi:hypothetical protein